MHAQTGLCARKPCASDSVLHVNGSRDANALVHLTILVTARGKRRERVHSVVSREAPWAMGGQLLRPK